MTGDIPVKVLPDVPFAVDEQFTGVPFGQGIVGDALLRQIIAEIRNREIFGMRHIEDGQLPPVLFREFNEYYRLLSGTTSFRPLHCSLTAQTLISTSPFCRA